MKWTATVNSEQLVDYDGTFGRLREDLDLCRQELAAARAQLEQDRELIAAGARAEEQLIKMSIALDKRLTQQERRMRRWGPLRRWMAPAAPTREEAARIRRLVGSDLFDGPWYLRQYPGTVGSGVSPALHYLRRGAVMGKDPGPHFDTRAYKRQHPELDESDNPLLHHLTTGAPKRR